MNFFIISFKGLSFIDRNQNKYSCNKTEIDEEVEFSLVLGENNKIFNKNIYDKNNCKILVTEFKTTEDPFLIFRTYGDYSVSGAQLVTCVDHKYSSDSYENMQLVSSLTCSYRDNEYECSPQGFTWCNFKDGNMFGYYIPKDLVPQVLNENIEIKFHLKGLLKYIWNKK